MRASVPFATMTPALACDALARVGLRFAPADVHVEAREDRWLVRLPDGRLAWLAASVAGAERLARERRVLRLLAERCTFAAPRVLLEDADVDVRTMVEGESDPWAMYARVRADAALARRVGASVGAMLAEQHTRITRADVDGWLPEQPGWPEPIASIRARLDVVVDDAGLRGNADEVLARYEATRVDEDDHALVHADLGLHNLAFDPTTHAVLGIFDYDDAAWADRHHDFRYLVFDLGRDEMLDAALAVYEPVVGRPIDRARVLLYNAACALTFLAHRMGTPPQERSCGRTLAEDLRWSRHAIARALDRP